MLDSLSSTSLGRQHVCAKHHAFLCLISEEAKKKFAKTKPKSLESSETQKVPAALKARKEDFVDKRRQQRQFAEGKFNLWPVIENSHPHSKLLYEKAIRLIEILYQNSDFYRSAHDRELARKVLNEICGKEETSFEELFPQNHQLAIIYYKMLKGTNSGYPALEDYFTLNPWNQKIQFRYASIEVLEAILGADIALKISEEERRKWEANKLPAILTREEVKRIVGFSGLFDIDIIEQLFDFSTKREGIPHAFIDPESKVKARR